MTDEQRLTEEERLMVEESEKEKRLVITEADRVIELIRLSGQPIFITQVAVTGGGDIGACMIKIARTHKSTLIMILSIDEENNGLYAAISVPDKIASRYIVADLLERSIAKITRDKHIVPQLFQTANFKPEPVPFLIKMFSIIYPKYGKDRAVELIEVVRSTAFEILVKESSTLVNMHDNKFICN